MKRKHPTGFTLIELMVVLALLALTAAAAIPAFVGDARQSPEERTARTLATNLIATRHAARETGTAATFLLSPVDGHYWIVTKDSSRTGTLGLGGSVTLSGTPATDRVEVRFSPQGVTTPVTIVVKAERTLTVVTDPWTGSVIIGAANVR